MSRRRALGFASIILLSGTSALAQTASTPVTPEATQTPVVATTAAADKQPAEAKANEIVVTGSRIARPALAAPSAITSFNAADIQQSGNTNITTFLQRVPALTGSVDGTQTSGYDSLTRGRFGDAGLNELNLRNLGTNRTLVLVDGRRHVAGEANTAAVDINTIPTDLIERVDVLTGGASAVYGADGVSGVVNFILKRNFEGVTARSQIGISQYGDGGNRFASIAAGHNFADGHGNVTLAYEYDAEDALQNDDRSYLREANRQYIIHNNANPDNANPNLPQNILVGNLHYIGESVTGAVDVDGDGSPDFEGNGRPYVHGTPDDTYEIGGSGTPVAGFVGQLLPRTRRNDINLLAHYDVSDAFKLSVEGKFVRSRATTFDTPSGDYPAVISLDDPFIPASIRAAATGDTVTVTRDNEDYGIHGEDDLRRTYRGVIDVAGRISDHATYDAYYEYGETDTRITKLNDRLADRFAAALDVVTDPATGQPICRSNLNPAAAAGAITFTPGPNSGCRPLNIFGAGVGDPAAIAWTMVNPVSHSTITQQVASGAVSGDFGAFFSLPGGPIQFSIGGEYRRETSRFDPDALFTEAAFYQYDEYGVVNASRGAFDVKEAFGELNLPILKNTPLAETLSVGAAARYSHYSTIGNTTTWSFNGVYAPVKAVTFRGTYGKSVRAPNIGELFAPVTGSQYFFTDPCDKTQLTYGTQYRGANCRALLTGLGANPDTFNPLGTAAGASSVFGIQSGNPNLKPETARTWTAGIVLRPDFVRGLTVSVDWYDIKLRDAINLSDQQTLAQLCVDQPTINNQFCPLISRQQGTGLIDGYTVQPQNVSRFSTAGADLNIDYTVQTARAGSINLRLVGGYLSKSAFIRTPGALPENDRDQPYQPKWNFDFSPTWTVGGLTALTASRSPRSRATPISCRTNCCATANYGSMISRRSTRWNPASPSTAASTI